MPSLWRQAFISHTGADRKDGINSANFATSLAERLEQNGVQVFIDHQSIEGGDDWRDKLVHHVGRSQVIVVVLSETYFKRYWCMRELDLAIQAVDSQTGPRMIIIPVFYGVQDLGALKRVQEWWWTRDSKALEEWRAAWRGMASSKEGVDVARWETNLRRLDQRHQAIRFIRKEATKSSENDLLRRVAISVYQHLPPTLQVAAKGEFVVDMAASIAEIKQLFSDASVVGIVGPGKY